MILRVQLFRAHCELGDFDRGAAALGGILRSKSINPWHNSFVVSHFSRDFAVALAIADGSGIGAFVAWALLKTVRTVVSLDGCIKVAVQAAGVDDIVDVHSTPSASTPITDKVRPVALAVHWVRVPTAHTFPKSAASAATL